MHTNSQYVLLRWTTDATISKRTWTIYRVLNLPFIVAGSLSWLRGANSGKAQASIACMVVHYINNILFTYYAACSMPEVSVIRTLWDNRGGTLESWQNSTSTWSRESLPMSLPLDCFSDRQLHWDSRVQQQWETPPEKKYRAHHQHRRAIAMRERRRSYNSVEMALASVHR